MTASTTTTTTTTYVSTPRAVRPLPRDAELAQSERRRPLQGTLSVAVPAVDIGL